MNANIAHLKTLKPVPIEELEKMHTGRLLSRLKRLRSLHATFEASDWLLEERIAVEQAGLIAFKNTELWSTAFEEVKRLLAQREHLPRGGKARRQSAAHKKQNR